MTYEKIAIMQPTFIPWLGYFKMIEAVDAFVFLDDVQFETCSWQMRNRFLGANSQVAYASLSVAKCPTNTAIKDVYLSTAPNWRQKLLSRLNAAYKKSDDKNVLKILENELNSHDKLSDLNSSLINHFTKVLGIKTPLLLASQIIEKSAKKEEHVLEICHALGASSYLAAPGSKEYLEKGKAKFKDIKISYHEYTPKPYKQANSKTFISHLSIIDLFCSVGERERESDGDFYLSFF